MQNSWGKFDNNHNNFKLVKLICTGWCCCGETIEPLRTEEYVAVRENISIGCKYDGYVNNIQWYRQYPRSKPEFLLLILESTETIQHATPKNDRLHTRLIKNKKNVFLEISYAELSDSAIYYCALKPTVRGNIEAQYKNQWTFSSASNMQIL